MKFGCPIGIFLNSANLTCQSTDISKCFRGSLRLRDNESRLYLYICPCLLGVIGWCEGPGNLQVPRRPTIWMIVGQGPIALAVGAGGGCFGHFYSPLSFFSSFSLSLLQTAAYRRKCCLKGPLNQPTNRVY